MLRTLTLVFIVLGLSSANATERMPNERMHIGSVDEIELPAHIASTCAEATHKLAIVCAEYASVYRELQQRRIEAERAKVRAIERLRKLTRGGISETLE